MTIARLISFIFSSVNYPWHRVSIGLRPLPPLSFVMIFARESGCGSLRNDRPLRLSPYALCSFIITFVIMVSHAT